MTLALILYVLHMQPHSVSQVFAGLKFGTDLGAVVPQDC